MKHLIHFVMTVVWDCTVTGRAARTVRHERVTVAIMASCTVLLATIGVLTAGTGSVTLTATFVVCTAIVAAMAALMVAAIVRPQLELSLRAVWYRTAPATVRIPRKG
jgi:hypothetical protein